MRKNENILALLQHKAEQVSSAAAVITAITNDWQTIREYMSNRLTLDDLTYTQQRKLERYNFIYSLLLGGKHSKTEVISAVMKSYDIKMTQAYEDYNCTMEVFSSVVQINKTFELQLELESAKELKRKAAAMHDWKAAAAFQKNIIAIQAQLPEREETPGDYFEGHTIEAVFNPALLGAPEVDMKEILRAINAKRKVPINVDMFETIQPEPSSDS